MPDRDQIERLLSLILDPVWYRARYRDVAASGMDPLRHFIDQGLAEHRDPNRWFDSRWYPRRNPDAAAQGFVPLLHYLSEGAARGADPHPRFDAAWYVGQHPDAAGNPLMYHLRVGAPRGWPTEPRVVIDDFLPSKHAAPAGPSGVAVDVIIPVYRDFDLTRRCVESVLADPDRPPGRIIVIDDRGPDPALRTWLTRLARTGGIDLLRNTRNLGFVASVNRGMKRAGDHDVVLLNSDTEVPAGWLRRLRAQAYQAERIATVSPLSNNAVICSWLGFQGAPIPEGLTLTALDDACRTANGGRFAVTPTTVGFCMYIRRAALAECGLFDAETFGRGYGEENDFCMRVAAAGWEHRIACDVFVRHEGGASFGEETGPRIAAVMPILTGRYPDYPRLVEEHVRAAGTAPYRFAATMALFQASGLPVRLLVSHGLDGGVRRHIRDTVALDAGAAHYLLLEPAARGIALSVPALPGHPVLVLAAERRGDLARVLRSAGVSRVQIHHLMGMDLDVRALVQDLRVPFDVIVHDYFALCPQVNLLPWPAASYCGEPGPAGCDACIAHLPSHGATDILSWRSRAAWQFHEAARVLAPGVDALERLRRHGVGENAILAPHEAVAPGPWPIRRPPRPGKTIRIAVLGALADHKGAHVVASVVMAADPAAVRIILIGDTGANFPAAARARMTVTGAYQDDALQGLLDQHRPHAIWFPAMWPETYSYTLSAAIEAGVPIAATALGVFPERLAGRPLTWLVPPTADPAIWLRLFGTIASALRGGAGNDAPVPPRAEVRRVRTPAVTRRAPAITGRSGGQPRTVIVIPETFDDGAFTPCAHIRLLRPLDHPATGGGVRMVLADAASALTCRADMILTQRSAVPSIGAAERLAAHAARIGARLFYDLDDDLRHVPDDHPEAEALRPKAEIVTAMLALADVVRVSTPGLAAASPSRGRRIDIVPNALDERIWLSPPPVRGGPSGPVRLLCMGTATHDRDFAMILPALTALHRRFGGHFQLDLIGVVSGGDLPPWIRRLAPPPHAMRSYPGFVAWLTQAGPWDIGLAPLVDSPFNASKSAIKALDYAALGLAVLASDGPAYRGSLADGVGGMLVPGDVEAWTEALSRAIRDRSWRAALAEAGQARLRATGTLSALGADWRLAEPDAVRAGPRRKTR